MHAPNDVHASTNNPNTNGEEAVTVDLKHVLFANEKSQQMRLTAQMVNRSYCTL
jgi:hypothetical protein